MKKNTILHSTVLVMLVSLASKLLGFVRQMVIANSYGSNITTDIFFNSSEFMSGLSGAVIASFTTALVALYIDIEVKEDKAAANRVASRVLTLFLLAGFAIIGIINLFIPTIAGIISPTYSTAQMNMLIKYLRIFSFTFIFSAFQSLFAAVLNANKSFTPGKLYGIVYNPVAIIFVWALSGRFGINALVMAYMLGNSLQILVLYICCVKKGFVFKPDFTLLDKNIKRLIFLSVPLLFSNTFMQLNGIIDKAICSTLGEGFASNYSYAYTLEQFITATITVTVSLVLLSYYASLVAEGKTEKVIKCFKASIADLLLLLSPIAVVAFAAAEEIVTAVYMRGAFTQEAVLGTKYALMGFAIGFPIIAVREMYIRLHFAYQETKTPMLANAAGVILNAALSILSVRFLGIFGITAATGISAILTVVILNRSIKKYIPSYRFFSMKGMLIKIAVACAVSALAIMSAEQLIEAGALLSFALKAIVGLVTYVLMLTVLRCDEFFEAVSELKTKIYERLDKKTSK